MLFRPVEGLPGDFPHVVDACDDQVRPRSIVRNRGLKSLSLGHRLCVCVCVCV